MVASLGRWIVRKLRPASQPHGDDPASLPAPTGDELRAAREELVRGGRRVAESFLELLVAADRRGGDLREIARCEVAALRPKDWLTVDLVSRRSWWSFPAWWRDAIDQASDDASPLGVLISSFHPDGHVREATTALLAELDDLNLVPALALRCGDWVSQVRDPARHAFERCLRSDLVGTLESAGEVALLVSRRQIGEWLAITTAEHLRSATDDQIDALVRSPHTLLRRVARTVAVEQDRLDVVELLSLTEREEDLPSRLICGRAAIQIATSGGDIDVLRQLAADHAVQLRQAALQALDALGQTDDVVASLSDRAGSVRAVAQHLARSHALDPAEIYRAHAAAGRLSAWTIAGLGETGTTDDRALIEPALDDPRPGVRAEAVRALRRLGVIEPVQITPFLSDPSPAVAKQAATALLAHARQFDEDQLRDLLGADQAAHTRRGAYRLLRAHGPWTRLVTNLQLLDDPSDQLHNQALNDIGGWLANEAATTYAAPSPEVASRLAQAIDDHADLLGPSTTRTLRFHARGPAH